MTVRKYGFPQYGDSAALWRAGLRSSTDVDGATLSGANTPSYDADLGTCFHRLSALTKAIGAGYRDRLTVTFWVSSAYLCRTYTPVANLYSTDTGNEIMCYLDMGTDAHIRKTVSETDMTFAQSGNATAQPLLDMRGADTQVRCDISIGHGFCTWYLEGLPVGRWPWRVAHAAPTVANIKLPGTAATTAHGPEYAYFRDVQVVPWEIAIPRQQGRNIAFLGDSFTKNGQYPLSNLYLLGCQEQYYGDTSTAAATLHQNGGMLPQLHGKLAMAGIHPNGGRIRWYGRGGAGVTQGSSQLSSMVDRLLTGVDGATETMGDHGRFENRPDIVCIWIGANDYEESDSAAWKAAYITEIDRLIAGGAQKIVINTLGPYWMEPELNTAQNVSNVDKMNAAVKELEAAYSEIVVVDLFSMWGGHTRWDPNDFGLGTPGSADRHPSTYGHRKAAIHYASAIINSV